VAQSIDVFSTEQGAEAAIAVLNERSGRWFDPELVQIAVALHNEGSLWQDCARGDDPERTRAAVKDLAPDSIDLAADQIDNVCLAFAEVIDAKSPFTYRHSMDVATAAAGIAETLGLPSEACVRIRRAGLLHDLGKLSVPNSILDKPTQLSAAEWTVVKGHPGLSRSILERVSAFRQLSVIAGNHHERLDGSGYPDKKSAGLLSLESRILSVADVFGALTEERPYRASLDLEQVASIMAKDVPRRLDPACYEALLIFASRNEHRPVQSTMLPELPPEACVLSAESFLRLELSQAGLIFLHPKCPPSAYKRVKAIEAALADRKLFDASPRTSGHGLLHCAAHRGRSRSSRRNCSGCFYGIACKAGRPFNAGACAVLATKSRFPSRHRLDAARARRFRNKHG
jgi:putative nucleotidyltransferase with HDIG domain